MPQGSIDKSILNSLKNNVSGIFGKQFSKIVQKLTEIKPELKSQPEMKKISSFLTENKSAKPKIITKTVPMKF